MFPLPQPPSPQTKDPRLRETCRLCLPLLPPKLKTRGCGKLVACAVCFPIAPKLKPEVAGNLPKVSSSSPRTSPRTKDPRLRETCRLCLLLLRAPQPEVKTRACGKLVHCAFLFPAPPELKTRDCGKLVDCASSPRTDDPRLRETCRPAPSSAPPPKLKTRGCGKLVDCVFCFRIAPPPQPKDPRLRETCRMCLPLLRTPPPN